MRIFFFVLAFAASLTASGELSGRRAPGFSLIDVNFKQHDPQDYRGKILLVELMQTGCPHCAQFSAILEEVVAKYKGQVVAVSIVNPPDTIASIKQYIAERKITIPVLLDCGQVAGSYMTGYPRKLDFDIPHLFVIDAQGMIHNDFGYSPLTKGIFEGRDLFTELDGMLGKSK